MIKKPMLAATLEQEDLKNLHYPLLGTPKLDGIRCLIVNGKAVTRKFKAIPNIFIRNMIEQFSYEGFDGEIILPRHSFNEVSSAVMTETGRPDFIYAVFDYHKDYVLDRLITYTQRMKDLELCPLIPYVKKILPVPILDEVGLITFEEHCLDNGYEGIMLRSPNSPYKFGRSTLREEYLMKFKRFTDGEAEIIQIYEKMHNTNEATVDELGHTKRSSHIAGQVPAGTLGGFLVRDLESKEEFKVGTGDGLNDELRAAIWKDRAAYVGKILKYKSQKSGEKDKPRFPVFLGFRDESDM